MCADVSVRTGPAPQRGLLPATVLISLLTEASAELYDNLAVSCEVCLLPAQDPAQSSARQTKVLPEARHSAGALALRAQA